MRPNAVYSMESTATENGSALWLISSRYPYCVHIVAMMPGFQAVEKLVGPFICSPGLYIPLGCPLVVAEEGKPDKWPHYLLGNPQFPAALNHHTNRNIIASKPEPILHTPRTLGANRGSAMCDYEEFLFECGHSTILLKSHCHFARNDPNHQCLGVKVLRESWRQEGQLCGACFDDGYRFDNSNRVICHLSSVGGPAYNRRHHLQHHQQQQQQPQQQQHRRRR